MPGLLSISRRRFKTAFRSHLASALIAAAVLLAWLLYWGYMEQMGASMAGRVARSNFPADFSVTLPPGMHHSIASSAADLLQTYQALEVETPLGLQPLAASYTAGPDAPLPDPAPGEVWLSESLRGLGQLDVGSPFQISCLPDLHYRVFTGEVAGFFPAYDFGPTVVVDSSWLSDTGCLLGAEEVSLYRWTNNANRALVRIPSGAKVQTAESVAEAARRVVEVAFSGGGQGVGLLFLFLVLGVGTFSLLTYLDSRRELALLKSMGLRPREMSGLFVLESACTALISIGLAVTGALLIDRRSDFPVSLAAPLIARAVVFGLLGFAAATVVPYLLAQRASVNELLFSRPVPLFRQAISELSGRHPALEPLLAAGFRLVRLPADADGFHGICFRQTGQTVKAGETVAWEGLAWGLMEREYLAPCDGEVVQADLRQGLLVIKPD